MRLTTIIDPRTDPLEKAPRKELEMFAQARNIDEIEPGMPASLMRKILRNKGITDIDSHFPYLRNVRLGQSNGVNAARRSHASFDMEQEKIPQTDATDDLMRQWQEQKALTEAMRQAPEPKKETIGDLRSECKRRGIKISRTDKMADLKAKLDGQDAPQCCQ